MPFEFIDRSDEDYYWDKAEFQNRESHARHVANYILGNEDCKEPRFAEVYKKEAEALKKTNIMAMLEGEGYEF